MSFPKNMRGSTPDSQTVRHVEMPSTGMHSKTLQNVVLKSSLEFPSRGTTPFSARSQNKPVTLFQPRGPYLLPHLAALSTIPSRPHRQEDEEDEEDERARAAQVEEIRKIFEIFDEKREEEEGGDGEKEK